MDFDLVKKTTQKIASPWGGHIKFRISQPSATKGVFEIQIENAIKAPMFVYGETSNDDWKNTIRKYSPPWSVLRVPGQLQVDIKTTYVNAVDNMEAVMAGWKKTWDFIEEFLGVPPNQQPGEERLKFNWGGGGYHASLGPWQGGAFDR